MMANYLYHGKLTAKIGQGTALAEILVEASKLVLKAKGCHLYVVSRALTEPEAIFVTEIWDSKEDHDNSLKLQNVQELIRKALPILDGPPARGQELEISGGTGF
jgi:quinol monooxygenase YgiN